MNLLELRPNRSDFYGWQGNVSDDGDLLFVTKTTLNALKSAKALILTSEDVRAQGNVIWSLNRRSWYAYALRV